MCATKSDSILLMISGYKGLRFLQSLVAVLPINAVYSYKDNAVQDSSFEEIQRICAKHNIAFFEEKRIELDRIAGVALVFVVGWQFLLPLSDNLVVFHDSLLPRYRGFSPTVSALINGEKEIGVTAFSPREGVDTGPLFKQSSELISYPLKIKDALDIQSNLAAKIAAELLNKKKIAPLDTTEQDEALATYSIWRDEHDYLIDWSLSSERILRTIDALGWPYKGAQSYCGGEKVVIHKAERVFPEKVFTNTSPGKIWSISSRGIEVLTGTSSLLLTEVLDLKGERFTPKKLRLRFDRGV